MFKGLLFSASKNCRFTKRMRMNTKRFSIPSLWIQIHSYSNHHNIFAWRDFCSFFCLFYYILLVSVFVNSVHRVKLINKKRSNVHQAENVLPLTEIKVLERFCLNEVLRSISRSLNSDETIAWATKRRVSKSNILWLQIHYRRMLFAVQQLKVAIKKSDEDLRRRRCLQNYNNSREQQGILMQILKKLAANIL